MKKAAELYELDANNYQRFSEQMHCIYRSLYDPDFVHYHKTLRTNMKDWVESGEQGFGRVELALAAASWTVNKHMPFSTLWNPDHSPQDYIPLQVKEKGPEPLSAKKLSNYVKKAAKFLGASKVGITKIDERWLYKTKVDLYSTSLEEKQESAFPDLSLPKGVKNAVIMAIEMNPEGFKCAPTFLEFASAGLGYSKMAVTIASVAQFIRNMGYTAIPCANDTALSVPLAIDAGLGALGRIGVLVTPNYGPRVRLCKVLTDMPLVDDGPNEEFIGKVNARCEACSKCADACEFEAISSRKKRNFESMCESNNPGVKKWYVNVEKCYEGWQKYSTDCGMCVAACPYSKIGESIKPQEFWNHQKD